MCFKNPGAPPRMFGSPATMRSRAGPSSRRRHSSQNFIAAGADTQHNFFHPQQSMLDGPADSGLELSAKKSPLPSRFLHAHFQIANLALRKVPTDSSADLTVNILSEQFRTRIDQWQQ